MAPLSNSPPSALPRAYLPITRRDTVHFPDQFLSELPKVKSGTESVNNLHHRYPFLWFYCLKGVFFVASIIVYICESPSTLYTWLVYNFAIIPRFYHDRFALDDNAAERGAADTLHVSWQSIVNNISKDWIMISTGSSGVFSVVVTILQLQPTSNNPFFTTFVIAALVLILQAIGCSVLYIGYKQSFESSAMAAHWRDATTHDAPLWKLLALPLSFIMWAGGFAISSLILLAWSDIGGTQSGDSRIADRISFPLQGALITSMVLFGGWKIYAARNKLREMATE